MLNASLTNPSPGSPLGIVLRPHTTACSASSLAAPPIIAHASSSLMANLNLFFIGQTNGFGAKKACEGRYGGGTLREQAILRNKGNEGPTQPDDLRTPAKKSDLTLSREKTQCLHLNNGRKARKTRQPPASGGSLGKTYTVLGGDEG